MLFTYVLYAYLLHTYLKLKCSLYIAYYIGTKGTKEKKGMNIAFLHERKTERPIKRKTYIYSYIGKKKKRVKTATKGHKKRGYKIAPK